MPSNISERSCAPLTDEHLARLAKIADDDHLKFTRSVAKKGNYRDRRVAVVLAQGAAQHYLDGKNGVKDLDVYTFYAAIPGHPIRCGRRIENTDFGPSELGRQRYFIQDKPHLRRWLGHVGRRVDLMVRELPVQPASSTDAVTAALQALLLRGSKEPDPPAGGRGSTPKELSEKAMIWLSPAKTGTIIWPMEILR